MTLRIIEWSLKNRLLVLFVTLFITIWGWVSVQETSLDAIPDLSDVQVIIKTSYPGQSPRVIEDQVTYPITTTMMSVPGPRVVPSLVIPMFTSSLMMVLIYIGRALEHWNI